MRSFRFISGDKHQNPILRPVLMVLAGVLFSFAAHSFWLAAYLVNQEYLRLVQTDSRMDFLRGNGRVIAESLCIGVVVAAVSFGMFFVALRRGRPQSDEQSLDTPKTDPYTPPESAPPTASAAARRRRANKWAVRALFITGIPALLIVLPVLLHAFGMTIPAALRLFTPRTPWFSMYPEMIAFPSAVLAWIASWVLPIKEQDWIEPV